MTIRFGTGNLLTTESEALVNTVNTVGVMGKGIALMFKEAYPENFKAYEAACREGLVTIGRMFVTERHDLVGPRWIVNFPTKKHWRHRSKLEWIDEGLNDLVSVIRQRNIRSIALPPLGAGNGGLAWPKVRELIRDRLDHLGDVDVVVYEPTSTYQNVAKRSGVERLTAPRALVAELVRRYWVQGMECTLLEVQKLAWFLERNVIAAALPNPLDFRFGADRYGPYSDRLSHLLDGLDGSYLHCDKRIRDAGPHDLISHDYDKSELVVAFLTSPEAKPFTPALDATSAVIKGFESPFGMELLATVDWIRFNQKARSVAEIKAGLTRWPAEASAAERKIRLFEEPFLELAFKHLEAFSPETVMA